jgi:acyl carrier protein
VPSVHEIKSFIVSEFVPEVTVDQLDADFDLLENGVVDSLGLLQLIEWVGDRFDLPVADMDLAPNNFQSVNAIRDFVASSRTAA